MKLAIPMDPNFESLVQRYLDERLSAEELAQLSTALEESDAALREFVAYLDLDTALGQLARSGPDELPEPGSGEFVATDPAAADKTGTAAASPSRPFLRRARLGPWLAAAAAIALLASGLGWWGSVRMTSPPHATVITTTGAQDHAELAKLVEGSELRGEALEIRAGAVELVTALGARLVIEAPAAFRFESPQRLLLSSGRLAAEVPPAATGFTVATPDGDAVDLGTRFGVDVAPEGRSEIHVFEGEVIASAPGLERDRSLGVGEAFSLGAGGGDLRELRSAAFIQLEELPSLSAGLAAGQRARAESAAAKLAADPALIALIGFAGGDDRPGLYRRVQGRWPGSRAAEFVEAGEHLELDIGGAEVWTQLTLAAWVRLDRLGSPYQSLLHTDGWSEDKPGQVHWMINRDATMRLALRGNTLAPGSDENHGFPDSATPVLPERGRWVHLATVYDAGAGTVRFYLNGRFDKETRQETAHPARLGPARIGNWDREDRKLSGRVDEFAVIGRALADEEIRALHDAGTPYRD